MTKHWPWIAYLPRVMVAVHDLVMVVVAWLALRWLAGLAGAPPASYLFRELALVLCVQGVVFWRAGLYRGVWRFASMPDLLNLSTAALLGLLLIVPALFVLGMLPTVPRRVLVPYPVLLVVLLGLPRLLYRLWKDNSLAVARQADATRVLVLGAGRVAEVLLRELRSQGRYQAVGLLDDTPGLKGAKVQGVSVLGTLDQLSAVARETAPGMLVIAMPSASVAQMRRVVALCDETGLPFRTVSHLTDQLDRQIDGFELKEVAIEDLLGRDPVQFDWRLVRESIGGHVVLITGAGGSIGSELARQCARAGVGRLILMERTELALDEIAQKLQQDYPRLPLQPVLADCGDEAACRMVLSQGVDFVFHAAACKQVPMLETQVREAMRNNVQASATLARVARAAGIRNFVLISTDKAIEPVSVLGASKRMAELVCQALFLGSKTHLSIVRFGNVLDSAGSVVPLFRRQILQGGPVTVTHPEVTRYFMTIPEACQLILQTSNLSAESAMVLTLDMGQPVAIRELAEQMIRLAGKRPGVDVAIEYIGLRPGEKLHETIFHPEESYSRTANARVLRAEPRPVDMARMLKVLEQLDILLQTAQDDRSFKVFLRETVHSYRPEDEKIVVLPLPHRQQAQR